MALTITNTSALTLLNILNANSASQAKLTQQLSTGKRINSGKDDPAGLLALSSLNTEITAVNAAITNNQRTDSILSVADGALGEISSLLGEIESLVAQSTSSGNLSASEISANQSQIDDALAAIDRIVSTTTFNGKRLIDGSFSIQSSGFVGNSDLSNLRIFSRSQSTSNQALTVTRVASASLASATFAFMGGAATTRTSGTTEVVVNGKLGAATITLASGLTQAQVVTAINEAKDQTGVSAIQAGTDVRLNSLAFGSDAFVSVEVLSGGAVNSSYGTATSDSNTNNDIQSSSNQSGADASVQINGQNAGVDGLDVSYSANGLSLAFSLSDDFGSGNTASPTTSFTVLAQGGATFQLGTSSSTRQTIGIDSLATYNLGGNNGTNRLSELKSGGVVDLNSDVTGALSAIKAAISELDSVRGRIGGFQKFQVGTAINALQTNEVGLKQAASIIGDTDYAVASAELNQKTVLLQTSLSLMGVVNQQSSQILALLG